MNLSLYKEVQGGSTPWKKLVDFGRPDGEIVGLYSVSCSNLVVMLMK